METAFEIKYDFVLYTCDPLAGPRGIPNAISMSFWLRLGFCLELSELNLSEPSTDWVSFPFTRPLFY